MLNIRDLAFGIPVDGCDGSKNLSCYCSGKLSRPWGISAKQQVVQVLLPLLHFLL